MTIRTHHGSPLAPPMPSITRNCFRVIDPKHPYIMIRSIFSSVHATVFSTFLFPFQWVLCRTSFDSNIDPGQLILLPEITSSASPESLILFYYSILFSIHIQFIHYCVYGCDFFFYKNLRIRFSWTKRYWPFFRTSSLFDFENFYNGRKNTSGRFRLKNNIAQYHRKISR